MMCRRMHKKCEKVVTNENYNKWAKQHSFILDLA